MKNKALKIILTVLFSALILFGIALYIYEITVKELSPTENVYKLLILVISGLSGLIKIYKPKRSVRHSSSFLERAYSKELSGAFESNPTAKRKLIRAVSRYNEGKFEEAISILSSLEGECECRQDIYSVGLFKALALTDSKDSYSAKALYEKMIRNGIHSSTVYGNLGMIYTELGMESEAREALSLAIECDPKNPAPHQNLATLNFDIGNLTAAKTHANDALLINARYKPSASLLAIIYSIEKNEKEEEKYTQIAIAAGENPASLDRAKSYYKNLISSVKTESDSDGDSEEE